MEPAASSEVAEVVETGMDAVVSSMDTIGDMMGKVWTLMTSNPLITLFVAASLLTIGVAAFRKIKRAAR